MQRDAVSDTNAYFFLDLLSRKWADKLKAIDSRSKYQFSNNTFPPITLLLHAQKLV